jgi:hypothetical protein
VEEAQPVVLSMQYVLFEFSSRLMRPDHVWGQINAVLPNVFDEVPLIRPVDDTREYDQVAMVHLSSSRAYSMNIARSLAEYNMAGRGRQTVADISGEFLKYVGQIQTIFAVQKPQRMGFVVHVFYEAQKPADYVQQLLDREFVDAAQGKLDSLTLRHVAQLKHGELLVNSATTVTTETKAHLGGSPPEEQEPGVQVTRDFNSAPGQELDLSMEAATSFVQFGLESLGIGDVGALLWPTRS